MGRTKQTARINKDVSPHADKVLSQKPVKKASKGKKEATGDTAPKVKKVRAPKKEAPENPLLFLKSPFQSGKNITINPGKMAKQAIDHQNGEARFAPIVELQALALRMVLWDQVMKKARAIYDERKAQPTQAPGKKKHLLLEAITQSR